MGMGRTRRKTRGSPGGDGGQVPDAPVFWFTFCWDLIYSRNLEYQVSHHCPLGAGCGCRERPGACAQVVAARVAHDSLSCGCEGWNCSAGLYDTQSLKEVQILVTLHMSHWFSFLGRRAKFSNCFTGICFPKGFSEDSKIFLDLQSEKFRNILKYKWSLLL